MEQTNMAGTENPQQSVEGLSFKGIFQVFYDPAGFFNNLKNDPKILIPYILIGIVFAAMLYLLSDLILQMQLESPEAQERLQGQQLTPELMRIQKYVIIAGGTIVMLLAPLLAAGLAILVGNFFMGLKARFKQILSVVLYSELIYAIGGLVVVPMVLAKKSLATSLSLGVLVASQGADSLAYTALSKIDLFLIWEIIVVGIGLAAVYNIPRNKGYVISVLSVGMLSVLHVLFTAVMKAIS